MLRIDHSTDIVIDSLRFEATAFWCIVPVHSQRISISNLAIHARNPESDRDGGGGTPNTDGIEPMRSRDVHIHDVQVDNGDVTAPPPPSSSPPSHPRLLSGFLAGLTFLCRRLRQDCVTVKSGSSNVLAERLDCTHSHGITIGSVWYDDVSNVTCEPARS